MKQFIITPSNKVFGDIRVPSDKSMSHRAVLLAAIARGTTAIKNPLLGDDVLASLQAVKSCGAKVDDKEYEKTKTITITSSGQLTAPDSPIDCGNSGTLIRLFCGIAAGQNIPCELVGDESLSTRPMKRITEPLTSMGAQLTTAKGGTPPIVIAKNNGALTAIEFNNHLASAQVKSAILLAGLQANGSTHIREPIKSRDHTERMLPLFGVQLTTRDSSGDSDKASEHHIELMGGQTLTAPELIEIPADISSAFFFLVAAAISPGSQLTLREVGINPTRIGGLELLMRMGADIDVENQRTLGQEEVADIIVRGGYLHGIEITKKDVPAAIDDLPALFIAAACARGETTLSGAAELRHKESDRITAMAKGLATLGIRCEERHDGILINGMGGSGKAAQSAIFQGGVVDSHGDHRIAMAFSVAILRAAADITINNCDNVATSFPNFNKLANTIGIRLISEESD